MTQYTIEKLENGVATLKFADGITSSVNLQENMPAETVDELAFFAHKYYLSSPSFLKVGDTRTAALIGDQRPAYVQAREEAYGYPQQQLEFITENGLDKWQEHVAKIKADNPKT